MASSLGFRYTDSMDIYELVERARSGDRESFGEIYDLFADKLFRYISIKIQDKTQAEDVLQEVFIKAWKNLYTLRNEKLQFSAWLYRIASNTVNDHFRKIYREPQPVELTEVHDVAASPEMYEDDDSLKREVALKAIQKLPIQYQEVIELIVAQELSISETARILKKSNLAIRLIQHRALKSLKKHLKEYDI